MLQKLSKTLSRYLTQTVENNLTKNLLTGQNDVQSYVS